VKDWNRLKSVLNSRASSRGANIALTALFFAVLGYFVLFYSIEVVAPGRGITVIEGSDVVIKAPERAYVKTLYVSQTDFIQEGEPLLSYRNIEDEYLLEKTNKGLKKDRAKKARIEQEVCFLYSNIFEDAVSQYVPEFEDCEVEGAQIGEGSNYVYQFYNDYKQEQQYLVKSSLQTVKRKEELFNKRENMFKKRRALAKGGAETVRFYDLEAEISDLNSEVISLDLIEMENQKKLKDKLIVFKMRRAERALELRRELENVETEIIEKSHQAGLLSEKKKLSVIYSPITGSVLKMIDGITENTYIEEGAELFVLKKEGVSTQIKAKFDSRYRAHLRTNAPVKIKITSPGQNYFFNGFIRDVSSDSLEQQEGDPASGRFYEATIRPDKAFLNAALSLGIDVEVYVVTDKATVFDYILSVLPTYSKLEVW